jgi:glycosyltransferase involved in cell wall biosynthesis
MPRVSVVMPAYNAERFVAEAVSSVLASRFADLELLLLDDGSTDGTVAAATRAAGGDARLRVIALAHGGVAAARNAGLAHARAELIANLDADDVMLPGRLERQVAYLDAHPACVAVGSRVLAVDAAGRPTRVLIRHFTHEEIDGAHLKGLAGSLGNPAATFRKSAAMKAGGYTTDLRSTGEDHDFWLRMAEVGRLANLPEVLTRYRVHDANVSIAGTDRDQRLAVTLDTLARAFARRGMTGRAPAKHQGVPLSGVERLCDAALLRHFAGDRAGALVRGMAAFALRPTAPATRGALTTILRG